jgi:hypothetical protein
MNADLFIMLVDFEVERTAANFPAHKLSKAGLPVASFVADTQ